MNGKRAFSFGASLVGNDRDEKTDETESNATIEGISVRIYPTPGGDTELGGGTLKVTPKVKKEQTGTEESLIRYNGKEYIDGDVDKFDFNVSIPVKKDNQLAVEAINDEGNSDFDYRVNIEVDYRNGLRSVEML